MTGRNASASRVRGFTLVELMVALTGGLFVSVMVFTLAKDSSRFYMRESRVADATLAAVSGFERLRTDLARISFMVSPNIRRDVQNARLCGNPGAGWPLELARLAGVRIQPDSPAPNASLAANGLAPDAIQIAGNFTGNDVFAMRGVVQTGAGYRVNLQSRIGQLGRLDYDNPAVDKQAALASAFPAGRALRIVDEAGMIQYGRITGVNTDSGPVVTLGLNPPLSMRGAASTRCGLHEQAKGYVNAVNFVRYQVRPLRSASAIASYSQLYAAGATPWEANRTELVREEVDVDGIAREGTEEIVAEYAVDLSFGLTVAETIVPGGSPTRMLNVPAGDGALENWVGDVTTTAGAATRGPHRVRAIRVRLAIRSREPDRDANIVPGGSVAPGLYRFNVATNGPARFARVRTLQADVALHNQALAQ